MNFNRWILTLSLSLLIFAGSRVQAAEDDKANTGFAYRDVPYSLQDSFQHVAVVYGASWVAYPLFQPRVLLGEKGSWRDYRRNLGVIVFDQDEPFWNWLVHPMSGSQLYLFYRALGHERDKSFTLAFLSSALFEFTIEIYSEPASVQDLYQTPVFGTAIGFGIEHASVYLLNHQATWAQILGRVINPFSYIVDRGQTTLFPVTDLKGSYGLRWAMEW